MSLINCPYAFLILITLYVESDRTAADQRSIIVAWSNTAYLLHIKMCKGSTDCFDTSWNYLLLREMEGKYCLWNQATQDIDASSHESNTTCNWRALWKGCMLLLDVSMTRIISLFHLFRVLPYVNYSFCMEDLQLIKSRN